MSTKCRQLKIIISKDYEYSFLDHDSVIKTSEFKYISKKRIKSKCDSIVGTQLLLDCEEIIFGSVFPSKDRELKYLLRDNSYLLMNNRILSLEDGRVWDSNFETLRTALGLDEYEFHCNKQTEDADCLLAEVFAIDSYGQESVHRTVRFLKSAKA